MIRPYVALALLVVLGFLSIQKNAFLIALPAAYQLLEINSEQYVLDGLLHLKEDPDAAFQLGRYQRPAGVAESWNQARTLFDAKMSEGPFAPYTQHFGGQLYLVHVLSLLGIETAGGLQAAVSALLVLTVAGLCAVFLRDFGAGPALLFGGILLSNPLITILGRNLYWLPFTWFLPMLAALALRDWWFGSASRMAMAYGVVILAFFIKIACGYEYITTVFVAACVPIFYAGLQAGRTFLQVGVRVFCLGLSFTAVFLSVLALHSMQLSRHDPGATGQILTAIERRVYSSDPVETARTVCRSRPAVADQQAFETCLERQLEQISANRFYTAGRYLIVKQSVPWAHLLSSAEGISEDDRTLVRNFLSTRSIPSVTHLLKTASTEFWSFSGRRIIEILAFWMVLAAAVYLVFRSGRAMSVSVAVAFCAPVSWFILAKGHSVEHHWLNVVLWFVPFVPYTAMLLTDCIMRRPQTEKPGQISAAGRNGDTGR